MKRSVSKHSIVYFVILFLLLCQLFSVSVLAGLTDPDNNIGDTTGDTTDNTNDQTGDIADDGNDNTGDDPTVTTPTTNDDEPTKDSSSTNTPTVSSPPPPTITSVSPATSTAKVTQNSQPSTYTGKLSDDARFKKYKEELIKKSTSLLEEESTPAPSVSSSSITSVSILKNRIIPPSKLLPYLMTQLLALNNG